MRKLHIQREVTHISTTNNLYRFTNNLIGVFIPLIIIQSGGSLRAIAGFYLIYSGCRLAINLPVMRLIYKRGPHFCTGAGYLCAGIYIGLVLGYSNTHSVALLLTAAFASAVTDALTDNSRHVYMANAIKIDGSGTTIATMEIIGQATDAIGPLIGALIATVLGIDWLLGVALFFMALTIFPLRSMGEVELRRTAKPKFSLKGGAPWRDLLADFSYVSDEAIGIMLWPIYLAVMLGTFSAVGSVSALAAAVTIVVVWVAGRRGDQGKTPLVLREGVAAMSASNIFQLVAKTPSTIAVASLFYRSSRTYVLNGLNATWYTHANTKGMQYVVSMQIVSDCAYLAVWLALFSVAWFTSGSQTFFVVAFVLAALVVWGTTLITPKRRATAQD